MSNKTIYFHCDYCNYDCKTKRVFASHIMQQKHIQNVSNIHTSCSNQNNVKDNTTSTDCIEKESTQSIHCEYCNAVYKYKKSYIRHMQSCKKKTSIQSITNNFDIPNDVMDSFIKSWKTDPVKINELAKHNFESPSTTMNQTNNIQQQTIIDNSNQTINNIVQHNTINIMPFGKEDVSMLTEDVRKSIYCRGFSSFEELINELYKNTNNINIYISNKREGTVKFINDKMEVEIGDLHDAVEKIVESKKDMLEDILDEFRGTQNIHAETRIKKLDKAHSTCERDSEYSKISRKKLIQITPIGKQNLKKIESLK
jgi:hypothetical protein